MLVVIKCVRCWLLLACFCCFSLGGVAEAKDSLIWHNAEGRVSAEISSWDITTLLEHIAQATSWRIYLEPNTAYRVSTKFKDRTPGEALNLLLGNLSYALVPGTNGPQRLYVFRTSLQEATRLIQAAAPKTDPTAKPIANELIVTLKPGGNIDELARKLGAKVVGRIDKLSAYRLSFEDAEAAEAARESLSDNSTVESVSNNYYMRPPGPSQTLSASSGFPFTINARNAADGRGTIIGLIDTSVQATGSPLDGFLLPVINITGTEAQAAPGQPTHGTAMFETLLRGLAVQGPDSAVKVLPVDVYGMYPETTTFGVAHGIVEAVNRGATIVNLSLGSAGDSPFLQSVIQQSSAQGVLFFAAAGNEPVAAQTYPAAYPQVLAVTAGNRDGTLAPYANRGDFVDLVAPGTSIITYGGLSWLVSGTSASSAYVSGLAGSLQEGRKLSTTELLEALRKLLPAKK